MDQLSHRDGVVALGYHIDYWDNLGWKDPFSSPEATARQRAYAQRFDKGQQFTPQVVVDGREDMVGSDRDAVLAAIKSPPQAVAPVHVAADRSAATIGAGTGRTAWSCSSASRSTVTTKIGAGENAHRTDEDTNAVLSIEPRGEWNGAPRSFALPALRPDEGTRCWSRPPTARSSAPGRSSAACGDPDPADRGLHHRAQHPRG